MSSRNTASRALAIVCGAAASCGALSTLCSDAIRSGHWTIEHGMMPLIVGIAIASGHLTRSALSEWKLFSALGFLAVFCLATIATVYNSVGRQSAMSDQAGLAIEAHNAAVDAALADLAAARAIKASADAETEREAKDGGCKRNCQFWRDRATETEKKIAEHEGKVAALGPKEISHPRAEKAAQLAALFGFAHDQTKRTIALLEPFLTALMYEVAAIVSLNFAFAHTGRQPARRLLRFSVESGRTQIPVDHKVVRALLSGPVSSNDELAERLNETKGEASKSRREVAHLLTERKVGSCLVIDLKPEVRKAIR